MAYLKVLSVSRAVYDAAFLDDVPRHFDERTARGAALSFTAVFMLHSVGLLRRWLLRLAFQRTDSLARAAGDAFIFVYLGIGKALGVVFHLYRVYGTDVFASLAAAAFRLPYKQLHRLFSSRLRVFFAGDHFLNALHNVPKYFSLKQEVGRKHNDRGVNRNDQRPNCPHKEVGGQFLKINK